MTVQCRVTGRWYDPQVEFNKIMTQQWVIDIMKRLKNR
jgi:hypothetical protein